MRTLLAACSIVMLVGAGFGCGDDSTSGGVDMAAGADMAVPVAHDMSMLTCAQILTCSSNCTTQACAAQCIAEGKTTAQSKANDLLTCALGACASDGGVDADCAKGVVAQAVTGGGPCGTQGTACVNDM